ncbi:hypothetical protein MANES_16G054001v8 [Manihot esculenta]|uniref:Uncharacterized protein n=1 Tax=Manihot esculenta TaxID=3983 RepID=A0ACB7G5Z4_MANES|nr:hypothetical protein MANES_16G054001v8 [Manihot esculenta]
MHYSGPKVKVYKVWPTHVQEGLIQNQQTKPNKIKSTKIYESTMIQIKRPKSKS